MACFPKKNPIRSEYYNSMQEKNNNKKEPQKYPPKNPTKNQKTQHKTNNTPPPNP